MYTIVIEDTKNNRRFTKVFDSPYLYRKFLKKLQYSKKLKLRGTYKEQSNLLFFLNVGMEQQSWSRSNGTVPLDGKVAVDVDKQSWSRSDLNALTFPSGNHILKDSMASMVSMVSIAPKTRRVSMTSYFPSGNLKWCKVIPQTSLSSHQR